MSMFAIGALRRLAEAEGLTRVELAVSSAREGIRQSTEDLLTAARILGERPALQRLLRGPVPETFQPCLGALLRKRGARRLRARARRRVDAPRRWARSEWDLVLAAAEEQGERFLITGAAPKLALSGAQAGVMEHPGITVIVLRNLDERLAARLTERTGVPIAIVDYASFEPGEGPLAILNTRLRCRAAAPSRLTSTRSDAYAASLPVASTSGETIALLEARLPVEEVMAPASDMTRNILFVAALIAALAMATSIFIGHYWISAVESLTDAAERLGSGDLAASIPDRRRQGAHAARHHDGAHAPQPRRAHGRSAPQRARGESRARRYRRRRLCRRRGAAHPVLESAGRAAAEDLGRTRPRADSAATC